MHKLKTVLARGYRRVIVSLLLAATTEVVAASGVYMEPEQFLAESFTSPPTESSLLWLSGKLRDEATQILSHAPSSARLRYWQDGSRTAWILKEIGKEQPITAGFVIEQGQIVAARVLSFQESRGWEIRNPSFTEQFNGAGLQNNQLDKNIDGISGATLSVRAMDKMSRLALLFHTEIMGKQATQSP